MSATAASSLGVAPTTPSASPGRAGASTRLRHAVLIASPVLAGLFVLIGVATDPGAGVSGPAMWKLYAEHPDPLQWSAYDLHWSYTFWALPAMGAFAFLRRRGAWLANIAGLFGIIGISTLPGILVVDFYDSAVAGVAGVDTLGKVYEAFDGMWAVTAMMMPGNIALMLCLPLAVAAFWRGGLVRWWALPVILVGIAGLWFSGFVWWGGAIMLAAGIGLAVEFALGLRRTAVAV
ncbi:hypothetical protein LXM50_18325 [Microbacterium sp. Au-Mic1]|uniref:hypothetical protein n=1 Tax=Microbacterium sp. Au-Mic1 TaxID=2906457 RepID=UPI001E5942C2|nr:hypothetical protein [Microbacterium sp. Au-Mic1]MCE4027936.1 hypothetical protein [Microbacterium sp. Au-Mic1]